MGRGRKGNVENSRQPTVQAASQSGCPGLANITPRGPSSPNQRGRRRHLNAAVGGGRKIRGGSSEAARGERLAPLSV